MIPRDPSRPRRSHAAAALAALAVAAGPAWPDDAGAAYRLEESLRDGATGLQVGGAFGPDGWTVTDRTDRIEWALPRLRRGSVEFTMAGMSDALLAEFPHDNEIFAMWDGGYGMGRPVPYAPQFRENHYKCMLRIYGALEEGRGGLQKLMWGMCPSGDPGFGACGCDGFFEEPFRGPGAWDGTPQRIRIEWGDGVTRYLRNGAVVIEIDWSDSGLDFGPSALSMSLGTSRPGAVDTAALPVGLTFSDLVVEGDEGPLWTCDGPAAGPGPDPDPDPDPDPGPGDEGEGGGDTVFRVVEDATAMAALGDRVSPAVEDLSCEAGDGGPAEVAYLKFDLSSARGEIAAATLHLRARSDGSAGGDGASVHRVADSSWSEATLSWANKPPWSDERLGGTGATEAGGDYAVALPAALLSGAAGGPVSFALLGGADGSHFSSKEDGDGARAATLSLHLSAAPPDVPGAEGEGEPGPDPDPDPDPGGEGGGDADPVAPGGPEADPGPDGDGGPGPGADLDADGRSPQASEGAVGCDCDTGGGPMRVPTLLRR